MANIHLEDETAGTQPVTSWAEPNLREEKRKVGLHPTSL